MTGARSDTIALIDYGMGNLGSVEKALRRVGLEPAITSRPADVEAARAVVLPGVGACGDCMDNLRKLGLIEPVRDAIAAGKPYLGICLGLQILFTESEESGTVPCLDIIPGRVVRFTHDLKVPQIGWNQIHKRSDTPLLNGVEDGSYVYFVHSYHVVPEDDSVIATTTEYGYEFVSSIAAGSMFATQFHPEKSQAVGLQILTNFREL
ncbi:MAG: imidazole glycerol phosphate synthase subunit HisH [Armatimonadota bacterium]